MDEQHDRSAHIAIARVKEIEPVAFARSVGKIQFRACVAAVGRCIPLPARDVNGMIGDPGAVVIFGLKIEFFSCHRVGP
jgi:hypothetical protein